MATELAMRTLLERWPDAVPRRGIVVTTLNEASPFKSFMLSAEMAMFERVNPDPLGARYVMVPYSSIAAIKLVNPTNAAAFNSLGFEGKLAEN